MSRGESFLPIYRGIPEIIQAVSRNGHPLGYGSCPYATPFVLARKLFRLAIMLRPGFSDQSIVILNLQRFPPRRTESRSSTSAFRPNRSSCISLT